MSRLNLHLNPETLFGMAGKCVAAILLAVVSWNLLEQPILRLTKRQMPRKLLAISRSMKNSLRRIDRVTLQDNMDPIVDLF